MRGALLPETYVVRSRYLTHWSYRSTWYIIVAGLVVNGAMYFSWQKMNQTKVLQEEIAETLNKEELELAKKKKDTDPLIVKFNEVVSWQSIGRIPLAPILDALEKAMQTEVNSGLTRLKWELLEVTPSGRRGTLTLTVFVSEAGGGILGEGAVWLDSVRKTLSHNGIKYGKFFVGEGQPVDGGAVFDVSFDLEDGGA
jgi:hypothetical protein